MSETLIVSPSEAVSKMLAERCRIMGHELASSSIFMDPRGAEYRYMLLDSLDTPDLRRIAAECRIGRHLLTIDGVDFAVPPKLIASEAEDHLARSGQAIAPRPDDWLQQRIVEIERGHPPHGEHPRTMRAVLMPIFLGMAAVIEQQGRQIDDLARRLAPEGKQ